MLRLGGRRLETVLSRAQGTLLGQLAGDSLGSLVEFKSPIEIRAVYPYGVRDLIDGGTWNTLAGQPTDDSELALALARTLVGAPAYSPEAAAAAYANWCVSGPFDIGSATRQALGSAVQAASRGEDPAVAAQRAANRETQANGALMRISPLGVFGWRFPAVTVADWARADASLTHPHLVCQDSNALFAVTVAYAVAEGPDPIDLYQFARAWSDEVGLQPEVRERVEQAESAPPGDYLHQQGWVLTALQNAFFQLLHAATLEEGIVQTIVQGGDTDTNGCIAGALLGACHGSGAIPTRWRETILACRPEAGRPDVRHPRPSVYWPIDALELAEGLVSVPTA
jgi:ADP-ribosyl-[dinitrogen reductase] hydrolase